MEVKNSPLRGRCPVENVTEFIVKHVLLYVRRVNRFGRDIVISCKVLFSIGVMRCVR